MAAVEPSQSTDMDCAEGAARVQQPVTRPRQLQQLLGLQPHPEAGHFAEVYRSQTSVDPLNGRPHHSALSCIYFLLQAGEFSRWHMVTSDEVWCHLEGDPLHLFLLDPATHELREVQLGPVGAPATPSGLVTQPSPPPTSHQAPDSSVHGLSSIPSHSGATAGSGVGGSSVAPSVLHSSSCVSDSSTAPSGSGVGGGSGGGTGAGGGGGAVLAGRCGPGPELVQPQATVPGGVWQATVCRAGYGLAACMVAPGFEFRDFSVMEAEGPLAEWVREQQPGLAALI